MTLRQAGSTPALDLPNPTFDVVPCHKRKSGLKGLFDIPLPGTGEKPQTCDGWSVPKFCEDCGTLVWRTGNCKSALCPDCSTTWRYDRSESVVKRLLSFSLDQDKRIRHFVVSPPDRLVSAWIDGKISFDELVKEVRKTVKWKSPKKDFGGVLFFHPYRLTEQGKQRAKELKKEEENLGIGECGDWKAILRLEDWRDFCEFSPHFHVLATVSKGSRWKEGTEEFDAGFIWKGVRELKTSDDIIKTSMYLLSHTGILPENRSIRWFGSVSASSWSFERASERVQDKVEADYRILVRRYEKAEDVHVKSCSECGGVLRSIDHAMSCLENFDEETADKLFCAFLLRYSGKDPPRHLEDREELECWLLEEFPSRGSALRKKSKSWIIKEAKKLGR